MIPFVSYDLKNDFVIKEQPSKTYKMDFSQMTIGGWTDGLEAVKQAVYKILETERYDYLIYGGNYGSELKELMGEQTNFVSTLIEHRITEALLRDKRISGVSNFSNVVSHGQINVTFTVDTGIGSIQIEKAVNI